MIISKVDSKHQAYREALVALRNVLRTPRGSKDARAEQAALREQATDTNKCVYCGAELVSMSQRHLEACVICGKRLDKMLMIKSTVLRGGEELWDLQYLRARYDTMKVIPTAFKGANGDVNEVIQALDATIVAGQEYKAARKESVAREAERNVEAARRREILKQLVQMGADPNDEWTKNRVDEIYWESYADEHL